MNWRYISRELQIHPNSSEEMVRKDSSLCVSLFMILIILTTQASSLTDPLDGISSSALEIPSIPLNKFRSASRDSLPVLLLRCKARNVSSGSFRWNLILVRNSIYSSVSWTFTGARWVKWFWFLHKLITFVFLSSQGTARSIRVPKLPIPVERMEIRWWRPMRWAVDWGCMLRIIRGIPVILFKLAPFKHEMGLVSIRSSCSR